MHSSGPNPAAATPGRPTHQRHSLPLLPLRQISARTAVAAAALGAALMAPIIHLLAWLPRTSTSDKLPTLVGTALAYELFLHVMLGPVLEEVVFRGLILQIARRYLPAWLAVGVSTALFALPHLAKNPAIMVLALPMGGLFAWMAIRSGSLLPGLACHVAFNLGAAIAVVWQPNTPGTASSYIAIAEQFPYWSVVGCLPLAVVSWHALARELARRALVA